MQFVCVGEPDFATKHGVVMVVMMVVKRVGAAPLCTPLHYIIMKVS